MEQKKIVPHLYICYRHKPKSKTRKGRVLRPFFTRGNKRRIHWMDLEWNIWGVCANCERGAKLR